MKIYIDTFAENVNRPIASIETVLKGAKSCLIAGRMDDKIVSMALHYPLKVTSFVLGDYLAIKGDYRNQGVGEHFSKEYFQLIDDIQFEYLLGEVEIPV